MPDLEPGDIVVCRSTDYADQLGVADQTGVTLEPRSAHCLVFFSGLDVSYWIPSHGLRRGDATRSARSRELSLLSEVFKRLKATEVQIEASTAEDLELSINHGAVSHETVAAVRDAVGDGMRRFEIHPGGMAYMTTLLTIDRTCIDAPLPGS